MLTPQVFMFPAPQGLTSLGPHWPPLTSASPQSRSACQAQGLTAPPPPVLWSEDPGQVQDLGPTTLAGHPTGCPPARVLVSCLTGTLLCHPSSRPRQCENSSPSVSQTRGAHRVQTQCQTKGCGDDPDTESAPRRESEGRETRSGQDGAILWAMWVQTRSNGPAWRWMAGLPGSDILHEGAGGREAWWLEQEALGEVGG